MVMNKGIIPGYYPNLKIDSKLDKEVENLRTGSGIPKKSFEQVMAEKNTELKFSAHAQKRIDDRQLKLSDADFATLKKGIEKLKAKGGRESVVVVNDTAFVVSVKNNTVVTVIDEKQMKDNVFTNIDSMIML